MTSELTLSANIDATHTTIDSSRWDDLYVVGDVHGCQETLERLLDEIAPSEDDLVVFVGDLVRKGPDSKGVLELVRQRPNFVSVRGNNEQKLLDGRESLDTLTDVDLAYIESMPVMLSWDGSVVVHGGLDHRKPVAEHTLTDLLNNRSLHPEGGYNRPFWFEARQKHPRVFFGHTVMARPMVSDYAIGLDTGCVYGGQLTAYDCRADELIAVEPPETHVSRSADSIVEPRAVPQKQ